MTKLRFAPSPTGYLHVGNARAALANALVARALGGEFLLRLDDTDAERCRPEFEAAIRQDLAWLGLTWTATFRQSERLAHYAAAAERLKREGSLYPCFESEEELRFKREQRLRQNRPPVYDRAMLKLTAEQRATAEANGKRPYWRFKLSDRVVSWEDATLGRRLVKLSSLSDPVLIRADGTFLYTFTSVVDDIENGITHIVRGEDHVTNTGIQMDLWAALGGNPLRIVFAHLPLLAGATGEKLSKRIESLSLRTLRRDGIEPSALTAYLASLGTAHAAEPADLDTLARQFDLAGLSHTPATFDMTQLLAANRRAMHGLPFEAVRDRLPPGADEPFWLAVRGNLDSLLDARLWWDVVAGELPPSLVPEETEFLAQAAATLPPEPWSEPSWADWTNALKAATGRKGRALFHPLRLALTGEESGPEMRTLLPLIGRDRTLRRLREAA